MTATCYVHTNVIAADWQRLARFYCDVFGAGPPAPSATSTATGSTK